MEIKIDTKEKFRVITPQTAVFSDKIAYEIEQIIDNKGDHTPGNTILNFTHLTNADEGALEKLKEWFIKFYEQNVSYVICNIPPAIKQKLTDMDLYDSLNITPTESEAWDIVQMEEMEREMFDEE